MAITPDEQQSIVSAVLSSIRTNSRTIDQLTPVTSLSDNDSFEINGGKRVTYKVLRDLIASLSSSEHDSLRTLINKCELKSATITVDESTATLSISSVGKTITASIPVATTSKAGVMTATDKVKLQSAYDTAQTAQNLITQLQEVIGQPNGIATLGPDGRIMREHLPDFVKNLAVYSDTIDFTPECPPESSTKPGEVVYCSTARTFLLRVSDGTFDTRYYNNWGDGDIYGDISIAGRVPLPGKLYLDAGTNRLCRWNGSDLVPMTYGLMPPVRCTDEADMAAKAALDIYAEGQQFYIPDDTE